MNPYRYISSVLISLCLTTVSVIGADRAIPWSWPFDEAHPTIQLLPQERWGLFRETDEITISNTIKGSLRIWGLHGDLVYDGFTPHTLRLPTGHYFVETDRDRTQFAVLPKDYRGAPFFGTEAYVENAQGLLEKDQQIQPGWVRVMGQGYWTNVQPTENSWHWKQMDAVVATNAMRRIIVIAAYRPRWVTDADFIPRYARFVGAMAHRYRGKLAAIEIWNEPWREGPWLSRLPVRSDRELVAFYAALARAAYSAIKHQDPTIWVVGPVWTDEGDYPPLTRMLVEHGCREFLDAFTYHDYAELHAAPDESGRSDGKPLSKPALVVRADQRAQRTRQLLGDNRFPILVDEIGLGAQSALGCTTTNYASASPDWFRGMCRAAKTVILYRSQNVEALIPHVFAMGSYVPAKNLDLLGWDEGGRGPHAKTTGFLMACYWLNGSTFLHLRIIGGKVFVTGWKRKNGFPLVIAWATEGSRVGFHPDRGTQITDIYGRPRACTEIDEEPLLIRPPANVAPSEAVEFVCHAITTN